MKKLFISFAFMVALVVDAMAVPMCIKQNLFPAKGALPISRDVAEKCYYESPGKMRWRMPCVATPEIPIITAGISVLSVTVPAEKQWLEYNQNANEGKAIAEIPIEDTLLSSDGGHYCWCKMTYPYESKWVAYPWRNDETANQDLNRGISGEKGWANLCNTMCANVFYWFPAFRNALYDNPATDPSQW